MSVATILALAIPVDKGDMRCFLFGVAPAAGVRHCRKGVLATAAADRKLIMRALPTCMKAVVPRDRTMATHHTIKVASRDDLQHVYLVMQ
jgi:hypothetical protein